MNEQKRISEIPISSEREEIISCIQEEVDNMRARHAGEFEKKTGNHWPACFISDITTVYNYFQIAGRQHLIQSSTYKHLNERFEALISELRTMSIQYNKIIKERKMDEHDLVPEPELQDSLFETLGQIGRDVILELRKPEKLVEFEMALDDLEKDIEAGMKMNKGLQGEGEWFTNFKNRLTIINSRITLMAVAGLLDEMTARQFNREMYYVIPKYDNGHIVTSEEQTKLLQKARDVGRGIISAVMKKVKERDK